MSNTSKRTTDMSDASADAWLNGWKPIFINGVIPSEFKATLKSHLQERETAARVDELNRTWVHKDDAEVWTHLDEKNFMKKNLVATKSQRLAELLAVGEGRG